MRNLTTKLGAESWRLQNVLEPIDTDVNEFSYADDRVSCANSTVISLVKKKRPKTKREKHKSKNEAKGLPEESHK